MGVRIAPGRPVRVSAYSITGQCIGLRNRRFEGSSPSRQAKDIPIVKRTSQLSSKQLVQVRLLLGIPKAPQGAIFICRGIMIDHCIFCKKECCICHTKPTLANNLKNIALTSNKKVEAVNAKSAYNFFVQRAKEEAESGKFKVCYELGKLHLWTKKEIEAAAKLLEADGFKCRIENEITAWYSNTDCDSADFIEISWE